MLSTDLLPIDSEEDGIAAKLDDGVTMTRSMQLEN